MAKLYTPLHTAALFFKTQLLYCIILLSAAVTFHANVHAQCTPPPAPVVVPNPAVVCVNNGPVKLVVQPTALTSQFCSGPVNIAVPDNNIAGASNTIVVSGIPAACTISNMSVTINMAHTWMGDMVFVLKAPNGQIINLNYRLSGTGGAGATSGFTNTVISSTGGLILATGINPWTGTYKADLMGVATNPPSGPTGYTPTSTQWAPLFSAPNGAWTLAFYDGATGDSGILNSWCLNFTYPCLNIPPAAPAVWSPSTGLFLNAACTIPYVAGTQTDTVYARPIPAGTYNYQVTHNSLTIPSCTSVATNVTVTSGVLSTITTQPVNQKVCIGNDAQFSVTATGTGLNYQWQVSTNGGVTYTNIINGGVYTGVNSSMLTITQPPLSMSGLRYRVIINGNNTCAAAVSNAALLTVKPKPTISFYSQPYHLLLPGLSTTLKSVLTPSNSAATYTWWHNYTAVPGGTADTLLIDFSQIGLYQVSVTDTNGCSNISDTTSIRDSALGRIFIYPNPSNGNFQLRMYSQSNTSLPRTVIVYNGMGTKVVETNYNQTVSYQKIYVDVRRNGKGLYWVEVLDKDGKRIGISKVMIQ